jgi:hypothetical protein
LNEEPPHPRVRFSGDEKGTFFVPLIRKITRLLQVTRESRVAVMLRRMLFPGRWRGAAKRCKRAYDFAAGAAKSYGHLVPADVTPGRGVRQSYPPSLEKVGSLMAKSVNSDHVFSFWVWGIPRGTAP